MVNSVRGLIIDKRGTSEVVHKSAYKPHTEALSLFEKGPLALVAGVGFEPATSGL